MSSYSEEIDVDVNPPDAPASCNVFTYNGHRHIIMFFDLEQMPDWFCFLNLLVHECVHAKRFTEDHMGERNDYETEAYTVQHLFVESIKVTNQLLKKKKDKKWLGVMNGK